MNLVFVSNSDLLCEPFFFLSSIIPHSAKRMRKENEEMAHELPHGVLKGKSGLVSGGVQGEVLITKFIVSCP